MPPGERKAIPDGRRRVMVQAVQPRVDDGEYPVKRVVGERVVVEADLIADGHDQIAGQLLYRPPGTSGWKEAPLQPLGNDRWRGSFVVDGVGRWEFSVSAWIDVYGSWAWGLQRKAEALQDVEVDLQGGGLLAAAAAERAVGAQREELLRLANLLGGPGDPGERTRAALAALALVRAHPDPTTATIAEPALAVTVDPPRALFGSWYELFPRSCGPEGKHGTFRDAESRLSYVADMGFDIVYLPPIHPIGRTHRKGPDNALTASAGDPGSPWAIGAKEGGHKSIHPQLGTLDDFKHLLSAAKERGLEVAMDIAFQASPDHPYVAEHPEWFVRRADGTTQYAENPPKKYQDIYPFDFSGAAWESLWRELRGVFLYWIEQGVRIFRVDNPHTKPIPFWEWCIGSIKEHYPEAIFLAEAFTRPKVMQALAKVGFSQSYTYFTWRTSKAELTEYVRSLVDTEVKEFFRPNFWVNTPDILPEHLQFGGRAAFIERAVLAATLVPSWGIYGPAFELQEHVARDGAEEYAQNEKYQLRTWDLERADSLRPIIKRLNQIRRAHPSLQRLTGTVFHPTDNDLLLSYSRSDGEESTLLVVVNLDPRHKQEGWLTLNLPALGVLAENSFQVHDLVGDARYLWRGARNFVSLDPQVMPAHIFKIRRRVHSEKTFEYYL